MNTKKTTVIEKFFWDLSRHMKNGDEMSLNKIYSIFPEMNKMTVSWRLHSLVQQGKLYRTGHGYYSVQKDNKNSTAAGYEYLHMKSQKIYDTLVDYGYKFYVSGLDSLVGEILHMPENYPVLIIVEESGMKEIQEILNEKEWIVFTEKDRNIIDKLILTNRIDVILLKGKDFTFSVDNISQKEKGFVDLYYAVTRMEYGVSIPELSQIFQNLQRNNAIVKSKMKNAARDRGIAVEINWLIELCKASEKALEFMSYQIQEAK
jgi:hypothetical protein